MADSTSDTGVKRGRFEATALPVARSLYNCALRLTQNPDDAKDLVQETFLRGYRTFDSFTPGTNSKAWLFTILYSVFINTYRKKQREPQGLSIEQLEEKYHLWLEAPEAQANPMLAAQASERKWATEEIDAALGQLPESFRSAILLVDLEELSYDDAAAALACPVGTLRSRLYRARRLLFAALQEYAQKAGYLKGPRGQQ